MLHLFKFVHSEKHCRQPCWRPTSADLQLSLLLLRFTIRQLQPKTKSHTCQAPRREQIGQVSKLKYDVVADLQNLFLQLEPRARKEKLNRMVGFESSEHRWWCRICEKVFSRRVQATDHIESQHLRILHYPCSYCDQAFYCSSARRAHIFANHREQNKMAKLLNAD